MLDHRAACRRIAMLVCLFAKQSVPRARVMGGEVRLVTTKSKGEEARLRIGVLTGALERDLEEQVLEGLLLPHLADSLTPENTSPGHSQPSPCLQMHTPSLCSLQGLQHTENREFVQDALKIVSVLRKTNAKYVLVACFQHTCAGCVTTGRPVRACAMSAWRE